MSSPLISIVTPSLNRSQFIREAIQSVLAQHYPNVEHFIMDGGSTDGTLEILREYPHLRVVSEPDRGMYDAINKGIRRSRGEIIGLLNTDDFYAEGCLGAVVQAFDQGGEIMAVCGGVTIFRDAEGGRRPVRTVPAIEPDELWYRLIQGHPVTNAWFFRRQVFEHVGYFDARYLYAADRYFLIRAALDGNIRPVPIQRVLYFYRQHSGSATITTLDSRTRERGFARMKVLQEDVEFLENFLQRPSLPPEVRRRMRQEHGDRCYRLAATALYHRHWDAITQTARRGIWQNIFWPLTFIQRAILRLLEGFGKHDRP